MLNIIGEIIVYLYGLITIGELEQPRLEIPLQDTHQPDLNIYYRSYTVAGSESMSTLPNSTVGVPTLQVLQRFKKVAHHQLTECN